MLDRRRAGWVPGMLLAAIAGGCDAADRVETPAETSRPGEDAVVEVAVARDEFCPVGWVRAESGGCGPGVVLCGPGGGAAEAGCQGRDGTRPETVVDPDGVAGTAFYRDAQGAVAGGWNTPAWICPQGWSAEPDGTCAPRLRTDCPAGTAALPDGTCTDTGTSRCEGRDLPDPPPEAAGQDVVYVSEFAERRPDGSREAPYVSLEQAFAARPNARWILLGRGQYRLSPDFQDERHFIGVCPSMTNLGGPVGFTYMALVAAGSRARVELRDLTLLSGEYTLRGLNGAHLVVRNSVVNANPIAAWISDDSDLVVEDSILRGTVMIERAQALGDRSRVSLLRMAVVTRRRPGLLVDGLGSVMQISNVSLRSFGSVGVDVREGGRATLDRVALYEGDGVAVVSRGAITAENLSIRDLRALNTDLRANGGVFVEKAGQFTARNLRVERVEGLGLAARGSTSVAPTTLSVENLMLRRVGFAPGGTGGVGVWGAEGARLSIRRARIEAVFSAGVHVETGASLDLRDTRIRGVSALPLEEAADGVRAWAGASLALRRVHITEVARHGLLAMGLPTGVQSVFPRLGDGAVQVDAEDVLVGPGLTGGSGVLVWSNAALDARRLAVVGVSGVGAGVMSTGMLSSDVTRAMVERGYADPGAATLLADRIGPRLDAPSRMSLDRAYLRIVEVSRMTPTESGPIGIVVEPGSSVQGSMLTLDGRGGAATGVLSDGRVTLRQAWITGHHRCAVGALRPTGAGVLEADGLELRDNGRETTCVPPGWSRPGVPSGFP